MAGPGAPRRPYRAWAGPDAPLTRGLRWGRPRFRPRPRGARLLTAQVEPLRVGAEDAHHGRALHAAGGDSGGERRARPRPGLGPAPPSPPAPRGPGGARPALPLSPVSPRARTCPPGAAPASPPCRRAPRPPQHTDTSALPRRSWQRRRPRDARGRRRRRAKRPRSAKAPARIESFPFLRPCPPTPGAPRGSGRGSSGRRLTRALIRGG